MKNTVKLSDVPVVQVGRISTGIKALDLCYGTTMIDGSFVQRQRASGLPEGGVSLWSGGSGVGKSRACIAIAASMNKMGDRVLFVQNEVALNQFKEWTKTNILIPENFYVHSTNRLDEHIETIMRLRPRLVVLDSINMIDGFRSPTILRSVIQEYKKAVEAIKGHAIIIGHLNKAGTVKGSNDIEYLIDIQCSLFKVADEMPENLQTFWDAKNLSYDGMFILRFDKNRYGPITANGSDNYVCFRHIAEGVEYIASNFESTIRGLEWADVTDDDPQPKKKSWLGRLFTPLIDM